MLLYVTRVYAADHCSLQVTVTDPAGKPVTARVLVEEKNGWRVELPAQPVPAKFCGLGITAVTVTVGDLGCDQVVVRNVPLEWDETTNLSVVYDEAPCRGEAPPVAACTFLLRFVSGGHEPAGGAWFQQHKPFSESHQADEFGRILIRIPAGQDLLGLASASGFKPTQVSISCESKNRRLEKKPGTDETVPNSLPFSR